MPLRTVLDSSDISRAIKRISHEILEANSGSEDLVLLGVPTRGVELAERIDASLAEIDPGYVSNLGVLDITMYRDDYVIPEDIHSLAIDVLRHRLVLSFSAKADGVTEEAIIHRLLETLPAV